MRQTSEERIAALKTILPKIVEHVHAHADIRSCLSNAQLDFSPQPTFRTYEHELWEAIEHQNTLRWRIKTVLKTLLDLESFAPHLAQAVWCEHVIPWPEWTPKHRVAWCEEGLAWMERQIKGEIPYCVENATEPQSARIERRNQAILDLVEDGESVRSIAKRVGCGTKTVQAVKSGRRVVRGMLV